LSHCSITVPLRAKAELPGSIEMLLMLSRHYTDAVPAAAKPPSAASPISAHLSFMVSSCCECEQRLSERGALNGSLK